VVRVGQNINPARSESQAISPPVQGPQEGGEEKEQGIASAVGRGRSGGRRGV